MEYNIYDIKTNDKILSIASIRGSIIFGGKSKELKKYSNSEIVLCKHKKSIKSVAANKNYFGCASYDCTATIFRDGELFDIIEGPETEIKSICFSEDNSYIAMGTRGKTVWICKIKDEIEIDSILEDHLHDVKGVRFHNSNFYSFGYDNTIKMYEKFDIDDSWALIQSIEEGNTVWNIDFCKESMFSCNEDGKIRSYNFENQWYITKVVDASIYPIYSLVCFKECVSYILNRDSLAVLNSNLEEVVVIKNLGEINCLYYCKNTHSLLCGLENGLIKVIKFN